jgi:hypothetical protein
MRYIETKYRPVIKTVNGCTDCYNEQDFITRKSGKPHYYTKLQLKPQSTKELIAVEIQKVSPVEPLKYKVIQSTFPSAAKASIAQYNTDPIDDKVAREEGLYGPYNDRKPPK